MKIRPQSELAHVQNKTLALNQAESVSRGRFDTALLQAAQGVRDSEGDAYSGLTPQARQALSEALENLSGKSLSQLKDLASDPEALAALLSGLSQGQALGTSEAARVVKLLAMALPRIMQAKSKSPEGSASTAGGAQGTQGRKQDIFTALGVPAAGEPLPEGGNGAPSGPFADVLNGANSGMAGIQGGQAYASLFGAGGSGSPALGPDANQPLGSFPSGAGAVLPVSVNAGASPTGAATGQGVLGANSQAGVGQSNAAGDTQANADFSPAGQVQADGQQASGAGARGVQADGADAEFPLMLDLDVQTMDPGQSLGVQPGTQVTLKGDNSWVYPESAQTQAPRQSQPQVQAQNQEAQGAALSQTPALAPRDTAAEGGLPVFGQLVAGTPGTQSDLEGTQGPDGQVSSAAGTGAKAPALSALEEDLDQAAGDAPVAPGNGGQFGVGQSANNGAQGGVSQAQASFQMLGQAPVALTQGQAPTGQGNSGATGRGGAQTRGSLPGVGGSGQAQNFSAALAAVGQDAGQGNNNAQAGLGQSQGAWAPGSPLPLGIAQAVNQALTQAAPATPGRLLIQLSPANLGSVQVELVLADGKLTAHLVAGQQDVRDALARDLPGFKAGLESHGIVVNEVSVALGADRGQDQNQNPSGQAPNAWRAFATTASREAADTAVSAGWGSYGGNALGTSQGFSALA